MKKLALIAALALTFTTGCYGSTGQSANNPTSVDGGGPYTMGAPSPSWSPATETNFEPAAGDSYAQPARANQGTTNRVRGITQCTRCN